jgi:hypothetical protein
VKAPARFEENRGVLRNEKWLAFGAAATLACSGSAGTPAGAGAADATADGTMAADTGGDVTMPVDSGVPEPVDSRMSEPVDSGVFEGASGFGLVDVYAPDGACLCGPYWCGGCGEQCDPITIACTVGPPACSPGCAQCPALAQVTCACEDGRCIRGGLDAKVVGCVRDQDCPSSDCCSHVGAAYLGTCMPSPYPCCGTPCQPM